MASSYQAIRRDNERRYGTDIGRIGPMLLADRYDDRTHFIFELLQNAEDALTRRDGWQGSRAVSFHLTENTLRVSHFGRPFDEADVRGICGIAESTKEFTAIGRFGIGFKSVYAFTDRPEVHSGAEDFAIESFVWPVSASQIERDPEETIILISVRDRDEAGHAEIAAGLGRLGASALLFLRQIEEIRWSVEGGRSGLYLRDAEDVTPGVRRVTVVGQEQGQNDVHEEWRVFSRPVITDGGQPAGHVEIAWSLRRDAGDSRDSILRIERSPLVVFFPTVVETHLGFLIQGPYRTTPSRDNVPRKDPWNQRLVGETASLLVEALRWLRDHGLLDTATLRCLPLDPTKFGQDTMFAPLFAATKNALSSESLLPRSDTGHTPAGSARLARTQELHELFTPRQLATLLGHPDHLAWLSGEITQVRAPELRQYLMRELGVMEITPEAVILMLDKTFLQVQPDEWVLKLYEFLNGQPALLRQRRLDDLPLIRLNDGMHVTARGNGQPQAFLPSTIETSFPTVRRAVCATVEALKFLQSLGITEPDPVDDVVWNVLPKYRGGEVDVDDQDYEADIRRILTAFGTDSKAQRDKLIAALRDSHFVRGVDAADGEKQWAMPGDVYLATERLKELFAGVASVLLVDDSYACLRGENVRKLLEGGGATRYLQPVPVEPDFTWEQRREMRCAAGCERSSSGETIEDQSIRGLNALLTVLPCLDTATARRKAELLWEALGDVEDGPGRRAFLGRYRWFFYSPKSYDFDAAFVRQLKATDWVPDGNGHLQRPELVLFETLGWKPNPFLQSKIRFKPPVIEQLAKEAGIDLEVLDLLKKLGVTSVADLHRLGIKEQPKPEGFNPPIGVKGAIKKLLGETPAPVLPLSGPAGLGPSGPGGSPTGGTGSGGTSSPTESTTGGGGMGGHPAGPRGGGSKRTGGSQRGRPFTSYVGADPDDEEPNPDKLDQAARMALEEKAIAFILQSEPRLQRMPENNPGFDLFEPGADGQPVRWVEVKAMTGEWKDRLVGLSRRQFECACERGEAYWLYAVEHAGDAGARIVRIQDPAGKARTFTFDHGWLSVADEHPAQENRED